MYKNKLLRNSVKCFIDSLLINKMQSQHLFIDVGRVKRGTMAQRRGSTEKIKNHWARLFKGQIALSY